MKKKICAFSLIEAISSMMVLFIVIMCTIPALTRLNSSNNQVETRHGMHICYYEGTTLKQITYEGVNKISETNASNYCNFELDRRIPKYLISLGGTRAGFIEGQFVQQVIRANQSTTIKISLPEAVFYYQNTDSEVVNDDSKIIVEMLSNSVSLGKITAYGPAMNKLNDFIPVNINQVSNLSYLFSQGRYFFDNNQGKIVVKYKDYKDDSEYKFVTVNLSELYLPKINEVGGTDINYKGYYVQRKDDMYFANSDVRDPVVLDSYMQQFDSGENKNGLPVSITQANLITYTSDKYKNTLLNIQEGDSNTYYAMALRSRAYNFLKSIPPTRQNETIKRLKELYNDGDADRAFNESPASISSNRNNVLEERKNNTTSENENLSGFVIIYW